MTTILPAEVTYGTVVGKLITAIADSDDVDSNPDSAPISGSVTFTPGPAKILSATSTPPVAILPQPIRVTLDADGAFSVNLIATNDPNLNPTNWAYNVSFDLAGLKFASFSMAVPAGVTTDIVNATPVATVGGTPVIQGPIGPSGVVQSIVEGANIKVNATDPANPIVKTYFTATAATTLGAVVKKVEIFDAAGASLGFIPVYDSIT